jgi:hypothetical protein
VEKVLTQTIDNKLFDDARYIDNLGVAIEAAGGPVYAYAIDVTDGPRSGEEGVLIYVPYTTSRDLFGEEDAG